MKTPTAKIVTVRHVSGSRKRMPHAGIAEAKSDPLPSGLNGLSPIRRRVRAYRKAGVLVGAREFLKRRAVCSGCQFQKSLPTHQGIYGCSICKGCAGSPERMLTTNSTCKLGGWA